MSPERQPAVERLASDSPARDELVQAMLNALPELSGDTLKGREVFGSLCSRCHRLDGIGEAVGPDLRALADPSTGSLVAAILDPNRAVEARYLGYTALTLDGRILSGLLVDETSTSVTLKDSGVEQVVMREELEALACSERSQMPEGLEQQLPPQAMADLLAYLQGGVSPKAVTGNQPRVIEADATGRFLLPASACEMFGPQLTFESRYRNLGFWSTTDDLAAWTLEVSRPGVYELSAEFSCPESESGDTLLIETRQGTLSWEVPGTGGWEDYERKVLGRVELSSGRVLVSACAAPGLQGFLIDLRDLTLTRVE